MKLTTRYNRNIIPAIILIFLISIVSSYFLIREILQTELDGALLRTKNRLTNYIKQNDSIPRVSSFNDQVIRFEKGEAPLADSGFSSSTQYIPEQKKNHLSRQLIFTLLIKNEPWKVMISQPLEGSRHLTILIAKVAVATISLTLLLVLLLNRRILSRIWSPFYQSLTMIKKFKVNDQTHPVFPDSSIEEFRLMNDHFTKAAENATRDYRNLKEFSENASHEIQTPLAIMRSSLDLLTQENMTARQSELLQSVYSSVRKLSRLQQSMVLLTKIDNRQFEQIGNIRIDLALREKMLQFQELLHPKNLRCSFELTETFIPANKELLEILLNNLFSNAIRHNTTNGAMYVECKEKSLIIGNTGIDQPLDPDRIFRRFYRNSAQSENSGLGLSIIKQICDTTALQVQYEFENSLHRFIIQW
jgi:signal transduction histidine kinase